jgi:hypothetical protein
VNSLDGADWDEIYAGAWKAFCGLCACFGSAKQALCVGFYAGNGVLSAWLDLNLAVVSEILAAESEQA